jgi:integrase
MATGRISKALVEGFSPAGTDQFLWDRDLRGFGLKVTPKGTKTYIVQYRIGGRRGRTERSTIGRHGTFTAEEARSIARQLLGRVAVGQNPAADKRASSSVARMNGALDAFFSDHVAAKLKPATASEYATIARLYIRPTMGKSLATEVTRSDVAHLHLSMRHHPYQANRTLALLSKFFNWCERYGIRPDGSNPCRHVERFKERKRERFLDESETWRLGRAIEKLLRAGAITPWAAAAVRLLLLTGARKGEILNLTWDQVDLQRGVITLRDSKTGSKRIPIGPEAVACLRLLPRLEGNSHVICGSKGGGRLVNLHKAWDRVRSEAELAGVRLHDLRHTFASFAVNAGASLPLIGGLLGHSAPQTTARYAHLADDPLRKLASQIGAQLEKFLTPVGNEEAERRTSGSSEEARPQAVLTGDRDVAGCVPTSGS